MARRTVDEAKDLVVHALMRGMTVVDAMKSVDLSLKTYERYRRTDKEFAAKCDQARSKAAIVRSEGRTDRDAYDLDFSEFRSRYIGRETYPHQWNLVDVVEGREPRWLHKSMTYEQHRPNRVIVNIPPYHAKSQTVTVDYVTYRVCMNPNVKILIVSKNQGQARKFLYQIKQRLTSVQFLNLQLAYGGPDGFKGEEWSQDRIRVKGATADQKDPTIEAIGMEGQIYGSRADLIILDDCVVGTNAGQYEKQITWIQSEVLSRVKNGLVALVGTRLSPKDLYSEIRRGDRYSSGTSPWTYLAMPMVLEFAEKPEDWVTLWPKSTQPLEEDSGEEPDEDGLYEAWPGKSKSRDGMDAVTLRSDNPARTWELVYQQHGTTSETVFHPTCVWGSVDRRRKPGPLRAGGWGHPKSGAEGMVVIASVDPAGTGQAFILVEAVHKITKERWVLNAWMGHHTTIKWYLDLLEEIRVKYGLHEVVVEKNGYSNWLIHDERFTSWCQEHGVRSMPHFTGDNKQDPDLGVASMAGLFGGLQQRGGDGQEDHDKRNIIHLPDPDYSPGILALIDQLITWEPGISGAKLRQDGPMALWFAELRARVHTTGGGANPTYYLTNRFASPRIMRKRVLVPSAS